MAWGLGKWAGYTDTTNTHTGTYRITKPQTRSLKHGVRAGLTPRHPATPLHRCPSLPTVCLQPHIPRHLPGMQTAPPPFACALPPPHARLSPSSCRPRSSHQAEPPPRSLPPPPPCLCALASAQLLTALPASPSLPSRLRVSRSWQSLFGSLLISRSRPSLSSSLTRVIFQLWTLLTFPSLSLSGLS